MDFQLKAQPSLRGWSAWAVGEIVRKRQQTVAEVTSRIIEDWLDTNYDFLESRYGVSLESFELDAREAAKREAFSALDRNPSLVEK